MCSTHAWRRGMHVPSLACNWGQPLVYPVGYCWLLAPVCSWSSSPYKLTLSPLPMELAIFFQPRWCISLGQLVLPTPPHHKTIQQISPRMTQSSRKHAKVSCLALPSGYMDVNLNEIYASKCLHSIKLPTVIYFPDLTFEAV